ncbi:hypothetical protein [Oryzomicrobium sp.]|uniref:hypothetical protein n=1 Tax=Oryzomicrobium sp. TaxID=1911578 RepID=UPI002FE004C3
MLKQYGIPFTIPAAGYGVGDDGQVYPSGMPEGVEGINYPAGTGPLFTEAGRAELGITEEAPPPRPDDRFYWVNGLRPDNTWDAAPKGLDDLRKVAADQVKQQRQVALDSFPKSSGIGEVYAENLKAAQAVQAGNGGTVTMRDGSTAEAFLGHMAAGMGIPVPAFAEYILAENTAAAVNAREIEAEYVRLVYSFIPACTFEQVQTVADEYRAYCQARTA